MSIPKWGAFQQDRSIFEGDKHVVMSRMLAKDESSILSTSNGLDAPCIQSSSRTIQLLQLRGLHLSVASFEILNSKDAAVHEFSTGLTRVEIAKNHGINFTIIPDIGVNEGIDAVRNLFNRCWFD